MPTLTNPRHEQFAALCAAGLSYSEAYVKAGYKPAGSSANASRLIADDKNGIKARIEELRVAVSEAAVIRAAVDREWVLGKLKENVLRAMVAIPVQDSEGNPIGEYRYQGQVANRGLELLGKELGMFVERSESTVKKITDWTTEDFDRALEELAAAHGVSVESLKHAAKDLPPDHNEQIAENDGATD